MRVAIAPTIAGAVVRPDVQELVVEEGETLARAAGLTLVHAEVRLPGFGVEWALSNLVQLQRELGDRWPGCRDELTPEIAFGMDLAHQYYDLSAAARVEEQRTAMNEAMADVFDQVDFLITPTNPDVAFGAEVTVSTRVGDQAVGPENNGLLTIPANITGVPAISIPAGGLEGLPVGMHVVAAHHRDALLLDLALVAERERPWPLVALGAPL
jgi:aspartyl-tRNA(Asn)/glutamyl-tRNA(Gln) amidotransferase subunit A